MQFSDFANHVQPDVFRRGQDVHALGKVLDFSEFKKGEWTARIEGSGTQYQTELVLVGESIEQWSCNCPYSESPVCKHVVGLYTAVALENQYREFRERTGLPQRMRARPSFQNQVVSQTSGFSNTELVELIAGMGKWNSEIRQEFEATIARMKQRSPGQP